ncbi:hypothetical protein D3C76_916010 [compost metagenome]
MQRLDGVRARRDDVIEDRQLILELVQLRRGLPRVAVQAHALTVGRLADHQHQRSGLVGRRILEVVQRRHLARAMKHLLHVGQGVEVAVISHCHLPWHRRLDAGFEFLEALGEAAGTHRLLDQRITDHGNQDGGGCHQGLGARQVHRAQAGPQEIAHCSVREEGRYHPPGKVLGHVLAGFGHVRFEHDEDDALGKFLLIDEEVTEAGHRARPQHHADDRGHHSCLTGEQQHRRQPDGTHHERLAKAGETGGAGQLDQELGDAGEIPEEQE